MRKRKRWIVLTLVILFVGATIWCVRRSLPPPAHNLLTRATKLADVQNIVAYNWFPNDQLLVKTSASLPPQGLIPRSFVSKPWSGSLDLIDSRTGTRTRLEGLTSAIMQHNGHYDYEGPVGFDLSPDGQWLLWTRLDPKDGGKYPVTAHLDGSDYREWNVGPDAGHFWLDGHRWGSYDISRQGGRKKATFFLVHDPTQPNADRKLPYPSPEATAMESLVESNGPYNSKGPRLFAYPSKTKSADLTYDIVMRPAVGTSETPATKIGTVTFPSGVKVESYLTNSQMTCIALLVSDPNIPPYVTLIRHLVPSYSYKSHPIIRLCIYRLDKQELHEVGRMDKPPTPVHDTLFDYSWLSDGKRIQFFHKNAVYVVSTD